MKGFKKSQKLNKEDLSELMAKIKQIQEYAYTTQALNTSKAIWVNQKIKALGLDDTKSYNIDFKTGKMTVKEEPKEAKPVEKPKK